MKEEKMAELTEYLNEYLKVADYLAMSEYMDVAEYLIKRLNKTQVRIKKLKKLKAIQRKENIECKGKIDDLYIRDMEKAFDMKDQLKKLKNKILCGTACREDKERFINLQAQLIDYINDRFGK